MSNEPNDPTKWTAKVPSRELNITATQK
jgi:hypothetical protein